MTKLKRENNARRTKRVESIGYKIELSDPENIDSAWVLRQPAGRVIQHYKYKATAITGAENDIKQLMRMDYNTLNAYWKGIVDKVKEVDYEPATGID